MPLESLAQAMNRISAEVRGGPLTRMARGGPVRMADGGAVYDLMGNVAVPPSEGFAPSPAYENIADAMARTGAAVGSPVTRALQTAADVYSDKSREAAAENEALRQQAMRNMAGHRAGMVPIGAGQMLLSQLGTATLPLTAAAKTVGHAATQATGNPRFGENVEFLSGFVDPTHVGMLKAAAPMAGAAAARQAVQTARELSPMGLYSHGAEAAAAMPQAKGSPEQMLAYLQNKGGVKPAELEGARAAFADSPTVTREELAQHFRQQMPVVEERVLGAPSPEQMKGLRNEYARAEYGEDFSGLASEYKRRIDDLIMDRRSTTQFGQYTLPGGENYREVLLKTPRQETTTGDIAQKLFGRNMDELSLEEGRAVAEEMRRLGPSKQTDFTSSHWEDPNVLAHIRMSDRTGPNGEKVLHVEELQSDWGQQGRKEGFGRKVGEVAEGPDGTWQIRWSDGSFSGGYGSRTAAETALEYRGAGVPAGPYVTSTEGWTDLALKRVLKEAAEGGYDKVVWTPGAEQAKRYDLSQHVNNITWSAEPDGKYWVEATGKDGRPVRGLDNEPMTPKQLEETFGKEIAEKIVKGEGQKIPGGPELELTGLDLQTGGEGMKAYYDKMVPKRIQELARKHDKGAKLGQDVIDVRSPADKKMGLPAGQSINSIPVQSLTITPAMRESILRGQPHMAEGGAVHMQEDGDPPPRPLTIYRDNRPKVEAEPETSLYPSQDERPISMPVPMPVFEPVRDQYADVSVPEAYNRRFADTVRGIPQSVIDYFAAKTEQPDPSQRIAEDLMFAGSALGSIPGNVVDYFRRKSEQPDPSQRIAEDITRFGGVMKEEFVKNPGGFMMDMANIPGMVTAGADAARIKREYNEAVSIGDYAKASSLKAQFGATMLAGLPLVGPMAKMVEKGVVKTIADVALQEADATARMAEKFAGKAGTAPEEMARMFDDVRGTQVGKMVERYQDLPPEEAMQLLYQDLKGLAVEGEVGKEWYERSSKRILEFVGNDPEAADKFAQLIAIYSPQTGVDVNTQNAMKAYNRALSGEKLWDGQIVDRDRTFRTIKAANDYVKSLGGSEQGFTKIPLDDSGKRFLIAKHGNPNAYENIATLDRDLKAHLVMNEGVPFNGRKTNNFYNNLMVQIDPSRLQGSTQDLWMARAFGYLEDAVGGGQKYEFMERLTADLAAELGWQPHQIQAAIWTAMKTRQESVKDAVKAAAIDMGIAERVPDPTTPGKMMFQVKEGREAEYGALMRERALGADITPEAIAAAARDFSDFLDQNIAFVTWEATPSTKVGHLEGFGDLKPEIKAEYQMGMQQALQDADGNDLLARYLNILSPGGLDAPGYWDGASNPQRLTQVGTTRIKAAGQAPTIDSASREMMDIYAAGMGLLLKQDGVGFHRPYYNPQISKANGIEYKFEKPLSSEDIVYLGKELEKKFGADAVGLIPVGQDTVRIINFYWPSQEHGFGKVYEYRTAKGKKAYAQSLEEIPADAKVYPEMIAPDKPHPEAGKRIEFSHETGRILTDEAGKQSLQTFRDQRDFHDLVDEIIRSDKIDNTFDARFFGSDGDLVSNTTPKQAAQNEYPGWKGNPNGEGYIQRLRAAGRSDVLEYISDILAPRVEAFDRAFAAKHGLKRNEALEGQIRNAKDLTVDYAKGGSVNGLSSASAKEVLKLAAEHGLHRPQIAHALRQKNPRLTPEAATDMAKRMMSGEQPGLHDILSDKLMKDLRQTLRDHHVRGRS